MPSASTGASLTSSATGQTEPTSSRRWRRSVHPMGRGFAVSKVRIASISLCAMSYRVIAAGCSDCSFTLAQSADANLSHWLPTLRGVSQLAASHRDDFGQDRDCNLLGRDRAEIKPGGRLQSGQAFGGYAALCKRGLERLGFFATADKGDVIDLSSQRRRECRLVASPLRRNDDVACRCLIDRQRKTLDATIGIGEGGLFDRRRADGHRESGTPRQVGDGDRHRARSANHDLRIWQDGLDKNIHGALARTHVLGEADAAFLFVRLVTMA